MATSLRPAVQPRAASRWSMRAHVTPPPLCVGRDTDTTAPKAFGAGHRAQQLPVTPSNRCGNDVRRRVDIMLLLTGSLLETDEGFLVTFEAVQDVALADVGIGM